jgi:hypothetical protein
MAYWGLKTIDTISDITLAEEEPVMLDFGIAFMPEKTAIVRVAVRPRASINTKQDGEANSFYSVESVVGDKRAIWWGLHANNRIIAVKNSLSKPTINGFNFCSSSNINKTEVIRVEVKEIGDYGEENWELALD